MSEADCADGEYYLFSWKELRQLCDDSVCASRKVSGLVSDHIKSGFTCVQHETVEKKNQLQIINRAHV